MSEEERIAGEAYRELRLAKHESYVPVIFDTYLARIARLGLDKDLFLSYLKRLFSILNNSQTPEQTNKNTIAAMALLKGKK